jgi:hypothetical protein
MSIPSSFCESENSGRSIPRRALTISEHRSGVRTIDDGPRPASCFRAERLPCSSHRTPVELYARVPTREVATKRTTLDFGRDLITVR